MTFKHTILVILEYDEVPLKYVQKEIRRKSSNLIGF